MIMTAGPLIFFFFETVFHTSGWSQSFGNPPASAPHTVTESTGIRAPLPTLAPQCQETVTFVRLPLKAADTQDGVEESAFI